jgi:hypothetical protein
MQHLPRNRDWLLALAAVHSNPGPLLPNQATLKPLSPNEASIHARNGWERRKARQEDQLDHSRVYSNSEKK